MNIESNRRILVVDDSPSIHHDFRKILEGVPPGEILDRVELELFAMPLRGEAFELDSAYQGQEAMAMVEAALQRNQPYALAFVDIRMPPGWDGVETVERLWQADPQLQIVICTEGSNHPWQELLARLDVQDRLLIVKKPVDTTELSQLARALTAKWAMARHANAQLNALETAVRDLRHTEAALRHSNRELEAFAHSMSHDLRAPLTVMSAFSTLLAAELAGTRGAKVTHYLERIRHSAQQGEQLIEGLLSLTRIARADLSIQQVDLSELATDLIEGIRRADPDRQVEVSIEPGLVAPADPLLIRLALRELLDNAWKFTGRASGPKIEIGSTQGEHGTPVFYVRDNGSGFDMAYADRLFRTFQRLHPSKDFPGNGIGLVRASRVIARHGGRVWSGSAVDQGSTFYFTLPGPDDVQSEPARYRSDE